MLIARRQTRALLYRLASELHPLPRTQLCYLFWPDVADSIARRNLTRLLVLLRRSLPQPSVLLAEDEIVSLDRDQVCCDTAEFARLTATPDPAVRRLALQQAVNLSRGLFLDGFALPDCPEFEGWMDAERRTWERRTLDTLAALIEAHTAATDYAAAIAAAQRYLQVDELAEDVHRRLVALYAAAGARTAALRQFERCALVLERELGVSPLPETRAVYEAVRDGTSILPGRTPDGLPLTFATAPAIQAETRRPAARLPAPTTALIGRAAELAEVMALLQRANVRLLTLSGPGGAGKTRLAIEVAHRAAPYFADGVAFVPLAPLRDAALVIPAITQALGLPDQGDRQPLARLQDALRDRDLLLVLDNFEHVAAAAMEVAALLAAAPRLTVLATSRTLLHISGEFSYSVPPLALADPNQLPALDALAHVDSVALFVARVRTRLPAFRLTEMNAREVAAICARLDGLPLAIELAAARAALLSPRMLLARLTSRLMLLTGGPRDLPERQRTLRATIDWSYRLLDLSEQLLFGRLAIFAGSWSLEAAEAVSAAVGLLATSALDGLHALLDQHLVQRAGEVGDESRFTMLETIREYALERLAARGEVWAAQQAHASFYLALAEAAAPALHGPEQIAWLDRLDEEQANLRVALTWLLEAGDAAGALRLAAALHWFWYVRGHFAEGRAWLERALAAAIVPRADPIVPVLLARAHSAAGRLAGTLGDLAAGQAHSEASVALWRALECEPEYEREARGGLLWALGQVQWTRSLQGDRSSGLLVSELTVRYAAIGDPWLVASSILYHGRSMLLQSGDVAAAQTRLLQALPLLQTLGDVWHEGLALHDLGLSAMMLGEVQTARTWYEQALSAARTLKERALEAMAFEKLGEVARLTGDDTAAEACYAASLRIERNLDRRLEIARLLHNQGYLALHAGDITLARARLGESLALYRASGQPRGQAEAIAGLAAIAAEARTAPMTLLAARLWGAAAAVHAALSTSVWPADQNEIAYYQALARTTIGSPAFDAAYANGAALSFEQAIAEALCV